MKVNIGDRIVSAETGKTYIVEGIERTQYRCKDTEGGGRTWLNRSMVDRRFYKEEQA